MKAIPQKGMAFVILNKIVLKLLPFTKHELLLQGYKNKRSIL